MEYVLKQPSLQQKRKRLEQKRTLLAQNVQKGKLRKLNNTSGASSTTMAPTRSAQSAGPIEAPGPSQTAKRQQAGAAAIPKAAAAAHSASIKLPMKLMKRNGGKEKGPGTSQGKSERYMSILKLLAPKAAAATAPKAGAATVHRIPQPYSFVQSQLEGIASASSMSIPAGPGIVTVLRPAGIPHWRMPRPYSFTQRDLEKAHA